MDKITELKEKFFRGTISVSEEKTLASWVRESDANADDFRKSEKEWNAAVSMSESTGSRFKSFRYILRLERQRQRERKRARIIAGTAAAAMLVLFFSLGIPELSRIRGNQSAMVTCSAPLGSTMSIKLEDGTQVWINSGSTVSYSKKFNRKDRTVELNGEAFFDVTHNRNLPFVVKVDDCSVTVFGTKFNVSSYEEDGNLSVVLVDGSLRLDTSIGQEMMEPGDMIMFDGQTVTRTAIDPQGWSSWVDGFIKFDSITVADFVKRLAREYNVSIVMRNKTYENEVFRASFTHDDTVESILDVLCVMFPMKLNKQDIRHYYLD